MFLGENNYEMLFVFTSHALVDRDEHNDGGCYEGKDYIKRDFFAVGYQYVRQDAPQKGEAYCLGVGYFSSCHMNCLCCF